MSVSAPAGAGVSNFGTRVKTRITNTTQTVQNAVLSHQRELTDTAVGIRMWPMIPLLLAGGAILYNQGGQTIPGRHGDPDAWKRILTEALLGHFLAQNTAGMYPLLGVVLAAYRGGTADTPLEKIHAVINTFTTLTLGWLGVRIFSSASEASKDLEDKDILERLDGQKAWIRSLRKDANPLHRGLGKNLRALQKQLQQKAEVSNRDWEKRKELHYAADLHKTDILAHLDKLDDKLKLPTEESVKRQVKKLFSKIEYSDSPLVKFLRYINPMCGYILVGLMFGAPLARWINNKVDAHMNNRYPNLKQRAMQQPPLFPQNNALLQSNLPSVFTGHHPHAMPNPQIIWPDS